MTDSTVRYSWRVTRPINRDVVCLQVLKYEWSSDEHHSSILVLDPNPHWVEFNQYDIIPESTIEFDGLEITYLIGGYKRGVQVLPEFDMRMFLADRIETTLKRVIESVMTLEPEVKFDAAT